MDAKDLEVKGLQSERSTHVKERSALNRRITAEETLLEKGRGRLHDVIQKAKVEQVKLPVKGGASAEGEADEEASASDDISTHLSQADNSVVLQDLADSANLDFSKVKRHRQIRDANQFEEVKQEFSDFYEAGSFEQAAQKAMEL